VRRPAKADNLFEEICNRDGVAAESRHAAIYPITPMVATALHYPNMVEEDLRR